MADTVDGNCFYISFDMPDEVGGVNWSGSFKSRIHLMRCWLAFFILALVSFLTAYIFGLVLCCIRQSRWAYIAGLCAYIAVDYLDNLLHMRPVRTTTRQASIDQLVFSISVTMGILQMYNSYMDRTWAKAVDKLQAINQLIPYPQTTILLENVQYFRRQVDAMTNRLDYTNLLAGGHTIMYSEAYRDN